LFLPCKFSDQKFVCISYLSYACYMHRHMALCYKFERLSYSEVILTGVLLDSVGRNKSLFKYSDSGCFFMNSWGRLLRYVALKWSLIFLQKTFPGWNVRFLYWYDQNTSLIQNYYWILMKLCQETKQCNFCRILHKNYIIAINSELEF
jgi:hypothetical protein